MTKASGGQLLERSWARTFMRMPVTCILILAKDYDDWPSARFDARYGHPHSR